MDKIKKIRGDDNRVIMSRLAAIFDLSADKNCQLISSRYYKLLSVLIYILILVSSVDLEYDSLPKVSKAHD